MKHYFASLFAVGIVATLLVVGCGDSPTVSQPDTAPPLAPVVLGVRGDDGTVGIWWSSNTESDLAGYHVYVTEAGVTRRMSRYTTENNYVTWQTDGFESVQLYVTAVDWTGNESGPSATKRVKPVRGEQDKGPIDGLENVELAQPR